VTSQTSCISRISVLVTDNFVTMSITGISMYTVRITRKATRFPEGGGDLAEGVTDLNVLMLVGAAGALSR